MSHLARICRSMPSSSISCRSSALWSSLQPVKSTVVKRSKIGRERYSMQLQHAFSWWWSAATPDECWLAALPYQKVTSHVQWCRPCIYASFVFSFALQHSIPSLWVCSYYIVFSVSNLFPSLTSSLSPLLWPCLIEAFFSKQQASVPALFNSTIHACVPSPCTSMHWKFWAVY